VRWHVWQGPRFEAAIWRLAPLVRTIRPRHVAAAAAVWLTAVAAGVVIGSPGARDIRTLAQMPVATVVLDKDDRPAFAILEERRYDVPLNQIAPSLDAAVPAVEDQRFYTHRGPQERASWCPPRR
jgi:membrane peptidoglycan carboxypeptidase